MKFIVTGGAGFIGSNLVRALNERGLKEIIIVDNLNHEGKRLNIAHLDYADYVDKTDFRRQFLAGSLAPPETVFHLGACSSTTETDEGYLTDNNFLYTRQLCEWCINNGVRFVYASSAATYGNGSLGYSDDHKELSALKPLNLYGLSKHRFDLWALENSLLDRIAGVKYFNVYGPGEDHKGTMRSVINKAYTRALQTGKIQLFKSHNPEYEDGMQQRDFVFVRDAVDVTLFFHEHPSVSGIFNCGTGHARTWIDLANALFAAMEKPPRIRFIDMPVEIRENYQYHTCADTRKLRTAGYTQPFTTLEDGVRSYVRDCLSTRPVLT